MLVINSVSMMSYILGRTSPETLCLFFFPFEQAKKCQPSRSKMLTCSARISTKVALGVIVGLHALRQAAIRAMPATMRISPHGLVKVTSVEPPYMTVQLQESKDKKTVKIPKNKVPK